MRVSKPEVIELSTGAIRCWKLLDWCRRKFKTVEPSIEWLASILGRFKAISIRSVLRYIRELKRKYLIEVIKRGRSTALYLVSDFRKWQDEQSKVSGLEAESVRSSTPYLITELKPELESKKQTLYESVCSGPEEAPQKPAWEEFQALYEESRPDIPAEEFRGSRFLWQKLDYKRRAVAIGALKARLEHGKRLWCHPWQFLRAEYKRPLLGAGNRGLIWNPGN